MGASLSELTPGLGDVNPVSPCVEVRGDGRAELLEAETVRETHLPVPVGSAFKLFGIVDLNGGAAWMELVDKPLHLGGQSHWDRVRAPHHFSVRCTVHT